MTLVAENQFQTPARQSQISAKGSQTTARSAEQLEKLLRTANLTNWESDRTDIQLSLIHI